MMRIIVGIAVVLLVAGCSTVRAPSIEEHGHFVELVRKRLAQNQSVIAPHSPFKLTMSGQHATAEYNVDHVTPSQSAFNPMKTEFSFIAKQWRIVDHRSNRPWLQQWK